jgi:hypothetical protein
MVNNKVQQQQEDGEHITTKQNKNSKGESKKILKL